MRQFEHPQESARNDVDAMHTSAHPMSAVEEACLEIGRPSSSCGAAGTRVLSAGGGREGKEVGEGRTSLSSSAFVSFAPSLRARVDRILAQL